MTNDEKHTSLNNKYYTSTVKTETMFKIFQLCITSLQVNASVIVHWVTHDVSAGKIYNSRYFGLRVSCGFLYNRENVCSDEERWK